MTPRWMDRSDEKHVRDLYARCHPDWPERPPHWFHAHPTLVLEAATRLLGFTSFTLSPTPDGYVAYLMDTCVDPDAQGRGYGRILFDARAAMARDLGAVRLVGVAAPANDPMVHLLASRGFDPRTHLSDAFPDSPGVVWIKEG